MKTYYRYVDLTFEDGVRLILERYIVEKSTQKGVWLLLDPPVFNLGARWMRNGSNFAHTTKEAAWTSYRVRKNAQMQHVIVAMRRVKAALEMEPGDDERNISRQYNNVLLHRNDGGGSDPDPCRCDGTHLCSSCASG